MNNQTHHVGLPQAPRGYAKARSRFTHKQYLAVMNSAHRDDDGRRAADLFLFMRVYQCAPHLPPTSP